MPVANFTSTGPTGNAALDYNIEVVFQGMTIEGNGDISDPGPWTDALQAAFIDAANLLSSIIVGDLPDIAGVDDLRIFAKLDDIDGSGGILGFAGPNLLRGPDEFSLPYEGEMTFDTDDADALNVVNPDGSNPWEMTILHEMLHVVGIGTLWELNGLIDVVLFRYLGPNGNNEWQFEWPTEYAADPFAAEGAPIEDGGGDGTALAHWEEDVFLNELMTGFIDTSGNNPISNMTIAALEDLGYETTYVATPCFLTGTRIATPCGTTQIEDLSIGDPVLTADGGQTQVLWVGYRRVDARLAPRAWREVVEIAPGALGHGLPVAPLRLTGDHALMIDGMLVNAAALVNGVGIDWATPATLEGGYTVWHVETAAHEVIVAEGAPCESYIDYVGRLSFDNADEYLALYGADRRMSEHPAPRITSARQLSPALRAAFGIDRAA